MQLNVGDPAPDFELFNHLGQKTKLSALRGQKIALYFYPEDDSPTCNIQACNLRDNHAELLKAGFKVLGLSPDNPESHQRFIKKFDLPFMLLSDPNKEVMTLYGTWAEKKMYGRTYIGVHRNTFLIDEAGVISKIILKVRSKEHHKQILA